MKPVELLTCDYGVTSCANPEVHIDDFWGSISLRSRLFTFMKDIDSSDVLGSIYVYPGGNDPPPLPLGQE